MSMLPTKNEKIKQTKNGKARFVYKSDLPTKTQQHMAAETDVNHILAKYKHTGILPQARSTGSYGDFSDVPDYATALRRLREADAAFMALPARVREAFDNNPQNFHDGVLSAQLHPEGVKALEALGLLKTDPSASGAKGAGASGETPVGAPEAPPAAPSQKDKK